MTLISITVEQHQRLGKRKQLGIQPEAFWGYSLVMPLQHNRSILFAMIPKKGRPSVFQLYFVQHFGKYRLICCRGAKSKISDENEIVALLSATWMRSILGCFHDFQEILPGRS